METYPLTVEKPDNNCYYLLESIMNTMECTRVVKDDVKNVNIIYSDDQHQIVLTEPFKLGKVYVMKDSGYNNKYLVLFTICGGCTMYYVYGFFIFFDNQGDVAKKMIIHYMLTSYDCRNTWLSKETVFLHKDAFLFMYKHRDTHQFIINPILFNTNKVYNDADMDILCVNIELSGSIVHEHNNCVVIKQKDGNYKVIPLYFKSTLNVYLHNDYHAITNQLPEISEFDGYPIICVKCSGKTSIATAYYGSCTIGLGNSFCQHCMIRYSKSDKLWVCCQATDKNICCHFLDEQYMCNKQHTNNYILKFQPTYFPPYLDKGTVHYTK